MVTVWALNALDDEKIVISDVPASLGERIVHNLQEIFPDGQFWTEAE